jgi:hypothetical protein
MRTACLLIGLSVALALEAQGQPGDALPYSAASRGAHETVWQQVEWETNQLGRAVARTNEFVEIATGLNHFNEATQQWQPSREEWEVYPEAIVARSAQHKAMLAHNLNLAGAVDVLSPDGVRLISSPVSLGFYDPVDGKQVVIAEVKDCAAKRGAVVNEILFRDCFDRIRGSMRYLFTKAGVHQHVVLEQRLELPEGFSDRSRLECYTVFAAETPWPQVTTRLLRREESPLLRTLMVEPDFTDSELDFGSMAMGMGKAFALNAQGDKDSIGVGKQYQMIAGLPVLIEAVEFKMLEPLLAHLASGRQPDTRGLAINTSRQIKRARQQAQLPREHFRAWSKTQEIQLANHPLSGPAVVIDYELLGSATNFTFKGDTTYFISGSVNLIGATTIEGGTVMKVTNSPTAKINVTGTLDCRTGPYRPAIFTSQYDTTVGEAIGSGTLTNYPGALVINTTSNVLHDLRISYATNGVALGFAEGRIQLANVQFVKCQYPIDSTASDLNEIIVDNSLFYAAKYGIKGGRDLIVRAQHVTAHQCEKFAYSPSGGDSYAYLTNCLLLGVTNWGSEFTFTTSSTVHYATDVSGVFQTVGAGSHYLIAGSTNRNSGTTNLNADLLVALRKKTTYPPVEITTNITANTTLVPQAARDTDTPDLGWHSEALDFVVSGRTLTNSTLTLTNGVVLGTYGASGSYGIFIASGGQFISGGSPTDLNRIVRYNTVQEQATTNWSSSSVAPSIKIASNSSVKPQVRCRFTGFSIPGNGGYHFYAGVTGGSAGYVFNFQDCQFAGSGFYVERPGLAITNSLFERVYVDIDDASQEPSHYLYNNLFIGGALTGYPSDPGTWLIKDNFFDCTTISATLDLTASLTVTTAT